MIGPMIDQCNSFLVQWRDLQCDVPIVTTKISGMGSITSTTVHTAVVGLKLNSWERGRWKKKWHVELVVDLASVITRKTL